MPHGFRSLRYDPDDGFFLNEQPMKIKGACNHQDIAGLGVAVPDAIPFDEAEMSPMARSFYAESKRVSNRRIKDDLGVRLIHPDYRHGLRALLAEGG